jgi:hypothetical protein
MRSEDEGLAQVTSGLHQGASVIVARLDGVKPGSKVRVVTVPTVPTVAAATPPVKG